MPHRCTNCGHTFPDGSKRMLSGCPGCGGNKFQFLPGGTDSRPPPAGDPPSDGPSPDDVDGPVGDDSIIEAPADPVPDAPEDRAQASARRAFVPADDLPPAEDRRVAAVETDPPETDPPETEQSASGRPNLDELREELNQQFESIKIVRPGEYELNLMDLYDRDEYIVALEEDGRYVIEVPAEWRDGGD